MRNLKFTGLAVVAAGAVAAASPVLAGSTTRIETRPFYGAVVTIEEGVRVFRPLPPTDRVIINPNGRTPLSLGFNETYVTEKNYNYNYSEVSEDGGSGGYVGGLYGGYGHARHHGGGHRKHGPGGVPGVGWHGHKGGHKGGGHKH